MLRHLAAVNPSIMVVDAWPTICLGGQVRWDVGLRTTLRQHRELAHRQRRYVFRLIGEEFLTRVDLLDLDLAPRVGAASPAPP